MKQEEWSVKDYKSKIPNSKIFDGRIQNDLNYYRLTKIRIQHHKIFYR